MAAQGHRICALFNFCCNGSKWSPRIALLFARILIGFQCSVLSPTVFQERKCCSSKCESRHKSCFECPRIRFSWVHTHFKLLAPSHAYSNNTSPFSKFRHWQITYLGPVTASADALSLSFSNYRAYLRLYSFDSSSSYASNLSAVSKLYWNEPVVASPSSSTYAFEGCVWCSDYFAACFSILTASKTAWFSGRAFSSMF